MKNHNSSVQNDISTSLPSSVKISEPYEEEINFNDLWMILIRYRWLIIASTFIFSLLAIVQSFIMKPVYRAEVLLVQSGDRNTSNSGLGNLSAYTDLAGLAGITIPGNSNVETAIATVKSRRFITNFVNENNLKPLLFVEAWDLENNSWKVPQPSYLNQLNEFLGFSNYEKTLKTELLPGEPSESSVYRVFEDILSINQEKSTGLIKLAIEWYDPITAAEWANLIVVRLNNELRLRAINEAERNIEYLKEELDNTSIADLKLVLWRLIEDKVKSITLANTNNEFAFTVIDPAVAPDQRIKPKRRLMALIGMVIGFTIAVFLAFVLNFIKNHKELQSTSNK